MIEKTLKAEPLADIFPCSVEIAVIFGIRIYRIIGTQADVKESTDLLEMIYPKLERMAFSDAKIIGRHGDDLYYELFVLERVKPDGGD